MDVTILYFTANVEQESFEEKVRQNILKNMGDLPLISVSQKPINFGKNICVGIHDPCYFNEYRQVLIGLEKINTPYVIRAEADFLYPPEYFQFRPTELGKCYRYFGVWVCYYRNINKKNPYFYFKGYSNGAEVIDREMWMDYIKNMLDGKPEWSSKEDQPSKRHWKIIKTDKNYSWTSENPAITFKTRNNISPYTGLWKNVRPQKDLAYWGNIKDLRKRMFGDEKEEGKATLNGSNSPATANKSI